LFLILGEKIDWEGALQGWETTDYGREDRLGRSPSRVKNHLKGRKEKGGHRGPPLRFIIK
jgi:hypothetical protein